MAELIARSTTSNSNYTGIKASIQIPATYSVPRTDEFINFYVGLNGTAGGAVEGGLSYGYRDGAFGWRYFLNNGDPTQFQTALYPGGLTGGQIVPVQLEVISGVAYFTAGGQYKWNAPVTGGVGNPSQAKQVAAAKEEPGGTVAHAKVSFSNLQIKTGGTFAAWSSSTPTSAPFTNTARYVLGNSSGVPLTATLNP